MVVVCAWCRQVLSGGEEPVSHGICHLCATALEATMQETRPAARELSQTTLPLANAALQDLKRTSAALRSVTERIETQGAGSLVGGSKLPDYKP